jgi:hypothetical protein
MVDDISPEHNFSIPGMGLAYDITNNLIWSCGQDWFDQYYNPANQATHHVNRLLGLTEDKTASQKQKCNKLSFMCVFTLQHFNVFVFIL